MNLQSFLVVMALAICTSAPAEAMIGSHTDTPPIPAIVPSFKIGDRPPPLSPMAWLKGGPVHEFKQGHVYVVNFFATWCGASRESIPELSQFARRYAGGLTAIGVNVRESERGTATLESVTAFVNSRDRDMDFIVAMDDPLAQPLFKSWMTAAGSHGTPTAFVIGRDGRLAYVGFAIDHTSFYTLETAIEQAMAGTSDLDAARRMQAEVNQQTAEYLEDKRLLSAMRAAKERNDHQAVLEEAGKVIAKMPHYEPRVFADRFGAMLHIDGAAALAFAQKQLDLVNDAVERTRYQAYIGRIIASQEALPRTAYHAASRYLETAMTAAGEDDLANLLNLLALARVHHRMGNLDLAIATQERAVAAGKTSKEIAGEPLADMEATLARYLEQREANGRGASR